MASPTPLRRRGLGVGAWLALTVVGIGILLALYTWTTLSWSYSSGERAGLLQKFSRRGWICKTYEGELALYVVSGVQPEIWRFSVRDEGVARQLSAAVGERVQLHYDEHIGVPSSCFGDTGYFVDGITALRQSPAGPSVLTTPSATP
jgi:hypothetical protein